EPGYEAMFTEKIKQAVTIPVILAGNINSPELAERLLSEGKCDVIGMARGLIAEPHFVKKTMKGQEEDIRPCIHCMQGCLARSFLRGVGGIRCYVNPTAGEEMDWGSWTEVKASQAKKVLIIGAGASGMECARVLAERGHKPVIYEKGDAVGGQIRIWAREPGSNEVLDIVEWMSVQLDKMKVPINLNSAITEANIEEIIAKEKPDEIVIATGSDVDKTGVTAATTIPIPGWDKPHVFTYEDIYSPEGFDFNELGEKVLVADIMNDRKPMRALEVLLKEGKDVTYITIGSEPSSAYLGVEAGITKRNLTAVGGPDRWNPKKILVETWIGAITDKGALLFYIFAPEHAWEEEFDSIVLIPNRRQNNKLYEILREKGLHPKIIGDAVSPRSLMHATHDGYKLARAL
ncbi:MAG: NAD(P)-binding protein, partial [Thermodesulfobacteriota bacterium]|nr:NAD(P)-binding protein [Thermodesulfobacteriota bacterium]